MREQNGSAPYARGMAGVTRALGVLRRGGGPRLVADKVRSVRRVAHTIGRVDDLLGRVRIVRMVTGSVLGRETDEPAASTAVPVTARAVSERPVWLRPHSRDYAAFEFLGSRYHLPPPELADDPRRIAVFGANIGLPLADLAGLYPAARLLGVEPEAENVAVARRNLAHLGERCELVEKAVWWRDEKLEVAWGRDAWGLNLRGASDDQRQGSARMVDAVDAAVLLDRFTGGEPLDYLLVNIESSWYEMLRHGDWTQNVRAIKIEIQAHYDEAVPLLRGLGYRARLERLPWGAYAVGIRP